MQIVAKRNAKPVFKLTKRELALLKQAEAVA